MTKEMYEDLLERFRLQISELNILTEEQDKRICKLIEENAGLKARLEKQSKAGRPKWHKVADGDFPKEGTEVLNDDGVKVILMNGHWRYVYGDEWEDDAYVDYWCEIPKFENELEVKRTENDPDKLTDDIMNDWEEMDDRL